MPVTKQSAVSRKKFAKPPVSSACVSCRAARVRCSGSRPCNRCVEKDLSCTYTLSRRGLKQHQKPSAETLSPNVDFNQATSVNPQSLNINPQQQQERLNMDFPQPGPVDEMPVFLPTLYNDNLNEFNFEDIFMGDSNEALDNFFVDVFSLPSYPQVVTSKIQPQCPERILLPQPSFCTYQSDAEVLQAYYRHIHPTFPILPAPSNVILDDTGQSSPDGGLSTEYRPSSPLILSLLSILVLAKPSSEDSEEQTSREASACSFAQLATESLRLLDDGQSTAEASTGPSLLHSMLPVEVETPLALCVLSQYQYLHYGNVMEMTGLAERAFDSCIRLSLHKMEQDESIYSEARKRAWWMTYVCLCYASVISCKVYLSLQFHQLMNTVDKLIQPPTRVLNMAEVTTPFPTSRSKPQAWPQFVKAEETLLAAMLLLVALVKGFSSETAIPGFRRDLDLLDRLINCQLEALQEAEFNNTDVSAVSDSRFDACFSAVTRIRLLSARIKTHRYRALMDHPGILKRFESIPAHMSARFVDASTPESLSAKEKLDQLFPFTSQYSLQVCFDSTMQLATCLDYLGTLDIVAPFACSAVLAGYTSMMILYFLSSIPDGHLSRLVGDMPEERCKDGALLAIDALTKFSMSFLFVGKIKSQLERVVIAYGIMPTNNETEAGRI